MSFFSVGQSVSRTHIDWLLIWIAKSMEVEVFWICMHLVHSTLISSCIEVKPITLALLAPCFNIWATEIYAFTWKKSKMRKFYLLVSFHINSDLFQLLCTDLLGVITKVLSIWGLNWEIVIYLNSKWVSCSEVGWSCNGSRQKHLWELSRQMATGFPLTGSLELSLHLLQE